MFGTGNVEVVSLAARFSVSTTRKSRVYKWVGNLGCTSGFVQVGFFWGGVYKWVGGTTRKSRVYKWVENLGCTSGLG
jgi:hypothetical protein